MLKFLDSLFTAAAWLSGFCLLSVLLCVIGSIVSRLLHIEFPGVDAYAGYSMAAATFLALASTLRHGEHIRVTLFLSICKGKKHFALDVFCHLLALLFSATLAWFSTMLVINSHKFNDISTSLDATPLWIPQIAMAIGTWLFFLAFVRDTIELLQEGKISSLKHDATAAFME